MCAIIRILRSAPRLPHLTSSISVEKPRVLRSVKGQGLNVTASISGGIKLQALPNRQLDPTISLPVTQDIFDLYRKNCKMPKNKKAAVSSSSGSDSDSGPDDRTPVKKAKVEKEEKSRGSSSSSSSAIKKTKSASGEEEIKFPLDKNRFITVREFRSKVLIDIRETYMDKDGEQRPGKKGIALTPAQWQKLKSLTSDIDEAINSF